MHPTVPRQLLSKLAANSGSHLYTAAQLIVKGVLESPQRVDVLCGPSVPPFAEAFEASSDEAIRGLLADNGCRAVATPTAERAIALATRQIRFGASVCALVPNSQLDRCMPALLDMSRWDLEGAAACVLLEDAPLDAPAACPRRASVRLGIPCLEATSLSSLKTLLGTAMQLSEWNRSPVSLVVQQQLLRSVDTVQATPNRAADLVDLALARAAKPRRLRGHEGDDLIRVARRLQVNHLSGLPNPGERAKYGFMTMGPCDDALGYLTRLLGVRHRVASMRLDMLFPLDDSAIGRFLERCENVVVLEPRVGSVEPRILQVAEAMRRAGEHPALIWSRTVPDGIEASGNLLEQGTTIHPSRLIRRIAHLFNDIRPGSDIHERLLNLELGESDAPSRPARMEPTHAARVVIEQVLDEVERALRDMEIDEDQPRICLVRDHLPERSDLVRLVDVEIWSRARFLTNGITAIAATSQTDRSTLMIVIDAPGEGDHDLERLGRAAAPDRVADRVRTARGNLADLHALREQLLGALDVEGVFMVVVHDGPPAQYDMQQIELELMDVDRRGFLRHQRMIWPANEACMLRPIAESELSERLFQRTMPLASGSAIDELPERHGRMLRARVRVLATQVEVTRSRPPSIALGSESGRRLPLPRPLHGQLPNWRVHLAGYRGDGVGVAATVLANAGRRMGYDVQGLNDPAYVGLGLHAWSGMLFTSATGDDHARVAVTPYGEANLLIGLHADEAARAVEPDEGLCVASPLCTSAVVNDGRFVGGSGTDVPRVTAEQLIEVLGRVTQPEQLHCNNFSEWSRQMLHTDRLTDIVMLGFAFQMGLIPVTLQAMEEAIEDVHRSGFGRLHEAFRVGRKLAQRLPRVETHGHDRRDSQTEIRRFTRVLRSLSWRGRQRADWYSTLVRRTLEAMPGLTESDAGRESQVDLARAIFRCFLWGGMRWAERYATLILRLYEQDRGDTGRAITRDAIVPLADALLVRDPVYVATVSLSGDEKRRIRHRLNVKLAREDVLERRFLTRLELVLLRRRFRLDLRTSAWLIRAIAFMRHIIPHRWRGTKRKRDIRAAMLWFVHEIIADQGEHYEQNSRSMRQLNQHSVNDQLHSISVKAFESIVRNG